MFKKFEPSSSLNNVLPVDLKKNSVSFFKVVLGLARTRLIFTGLQEGAQPGG